MNITVQINTHPSVSELTRDVNYRLFSQLATAYPDIHISFVSDNKIDSCDFHETDTTFFSIGPVMTNSITTGLWYRFSLLRFLQKNKADVFVSNSVRCNLKHQSRQIITITSDTQLKPMFRSFIKAAKLIIVPNEYIRNLLIEKYPESENKTFNLSLLPNDNIIPLNFTQKEEVRSVISEGKDYFLLYAENAGEEKIISCLKAFSFFKKWQQSAMKLLIIANDKQKTALSKQLETYKYRNDVKLLASEKKDVACAAAYSCIFISDKQMIDSKMNDCMHMQIPLIVEDNAYYRSSFGESVLYAKSDEKELSQKMILMYKDETLKNEYTTEAFKKITAVSFKERCGNFMNAIIGSSM